MSPEQVRAKEFDARTDLFSFGAVLYEMATGSLPFRGESSGVIFKAILDWDANVRSAAESRSASRSWNEIINKCLEKDRNLRYQHASEIRTDLQRLKRDTESSQTVPASQHRLTRLLKGRQALDRPSRLHRRHRAGGRLALGTCDLAGQPRLIPLPCCPSPTGVEMPMPTISATASRNR